MLQVSLEPLSGRQKRNIVAWILGLSIILTYSVLVNPGESNITTCQFHELTGLDCPTCGISRSFYAVSHFDLLNAFRHHIFGPILFTSFLFMLIYFMVELISKKEIQIKISFIKFRWFAGVFIGLWITTWIFRIII